MNHEVAQLRVVMQQGLAPQPVDQCLPVRRGEYRLQGVVIDVIRAYAVGRRQQMEVVIAEDSDGG